MKTKPMATDSRKNDKGKNGYYSFRTNVILDQALTAVDKSILPPIYHST